MEIKKTVAIITNRLVIGGITNDVISLAHHLKDDFDIHIFYGEREPDEKEATHLIENERNISFKKIPSLRKSISFLNDFKAYRTLTRELERRNCSIVHTHGSKSGFLGRLAARKNMVPCIIHTFHGHLFHSYYNSFVSSFIVKFERMMARITTHIVAISDQQAKALTDIYKIAPPGKIAVIYLGIDKTFFHETLPINTPVIKRKFKFSDDTVAIGMIGRIVAIKNCELFANIAKQILSTPENRNVKFFVVGDGKEKEKLQHDLEVRNIKWSIEENYNDDTTVIFTSWVSSVSGILKDLDIVMLTSKNEGTPLSLIEAQSYGKPVVATDAGGVKDTFIDNETGFLIKQNDIEMFVNKLSLLIKDKSLREEMGKKAKVFATQKFSKEAEVNNIKRLYNECKTKTSQ